MITSIARTVAAELTVATLGPVAMIVALPMGAVRLTIAQPELALAVVTGGHGAGLEAFARMVNA